MMLTTTETTTTTMTSMTMSMMTLITTMRTKTKNKFNKCQAREPESNAEIERIRTSTRGYNGASKSRRHIQQLDWDKTESSHRMYINVIMRLVYLSFYNFRLGHYRPTGAWSNVMEKNRQRHLFFVACTRLYNLLCLSVGRLVGWSVGHTLLFFMILFLWPHCSCPRCLVTSNMVPAHPHATSVAVYPALLDSCRV